MTISYDNDKAYYSLKKADWFVLIVVRRKIKQFCDDARLILWKLRDALFVFPVTIAPILTIAIRTYRSLSSLVHSVYSGL